MQFTTLFTLGLITLASAAPNGAPLSARDKFVPCSTMGDNCASADQRFCDANTGKMSICHQFGSDCWIRYTQDACSAKRESPEALTPAIEKRDKFEKCSVFGEGCDVDGNDFCYQGKKSVCHHVPFTNECWVRFTAEGC